MTQYYTYLHCRPDGSPFYVGKGKGRRSHVFDNTRNLHHRNTVAKYGVENIQVLVFPCDSHDQAVSDEIHQIAQLRRDGYSLCNQTDGGEGAPGYKHTDDSLRKMSELKLGKTSWNKGRAMSDLTRAKLSASRTGKNLGNKNCVGRAPWNKGLSGHCSAETIEKMQRAKIGNNNAARPHKRKATK